MPPTKVFFASREHVELLAMVTALVAAMDDTLFLPSLCVEKKEKEKKTLFADRLLALAVSVWIWLFSFQLFPSLKNHTILH